MSNEELKKIFKTGQPVAHKGIVYSCISAIIYRKNKKGGIQISVELLDDCKHSVTIAEASRITVTQN